MKTDVRIFLFLFLLRVVSVFLVQTWFVPDEYWQSLEVAHNLVFHYGYLTWEWILGIRSYAYPLIIAAFYKLLQIFNLDTALAIIIGPRILQAILSAYSDLCYYRWAGKKKWALFNIVFSWFWFYAASRTLINTFETCITTIALSHFPWIGRKKGNKVFLLLVAIVCAARPTAAIVWFPLCIYHLHISNEKFSSTFLKQYLPIGVLTLLLSTLLDSLAHGTFVLTSFEFLKLNVLRGIGSFYGIHEWYWYLSSGLPTLLGIHTIPFIIATIHILKNRYAYPNELALLGCIVFTIGSYSLLSHKEFRFILPLLPIILFINSNYLSRWSQKKNRILVLFIIGTIAIGNIIPAWYLSTFHQRGTLDVMTSLRDIAVKNPKDSSFLFLMPCHSTPLYSHLHMNIPVRFLTCEPNLRNKSDYVDEADKFYKDPSKWLRLEYPPTGKLPSHIITFDVLAPFITDILSRYKVIHKVFHTNTPTEGRIGKYVLIHEKYELIRN